MSENEAEARSFSPLDARNHISGTAEARVTKFCTRVDYTECYRWDDALPASGRGQGHVNRFLKFHPQSCP